MREIARRFALQRRLCLVGASGLATLTTIAALGAPSASAAGAVTVKTSFEQSPISLNTSDAIGFAITNTTGSTVSNLTFTDTLPAGVTLDDPIGLTNTAGSTTSCGTTTSVNPATNNLSAPGDNAVTVTVASVPTLASGTVCTISFGIVANQSSVSDAPLSDSYGTLVSPVTKATTATLIVLNKPTITLSAPANGLTLKFGQIYASAFSCAATDPLDSVNSVFADDGNGNQVNSGEPIDTVDAGTDTFEVNCNSGAGGGQLTQTVNFTVKPFKLASVKSNSANGQVTFKSALPAGKGIAELLLGKRVIGKTSFRVRARKTAKLAVTPTAAGLSLLTAAGAKGAKVKLEVSFTPNAIGVGNDAITPQAATVVTKSLKLTA